jgi:hypothetical protein
MLSAPAWTFVATEGLLMLPPTQRGPRLPVAAPAVKVVASTDSGEKDKAEAQYVCDGSDDTEIQVALDALPQSGGKVILRKGAYLLGHCVMPKDNTEMDIQGPLKVAPATFSRLTAYYPSEQNTVIVEDERKFRVGQWVTLMDQAKWKHKHSWENHRGGRIYGDCATLDRIEGDTITLRGTFGTWDAAAARRTGKDSIYRPGYSVAANAFLTTSHSAILARQRNRVYIHGTGAVDGNKTQQERTAPPPRSEALRKCWPIPAS